MVTVKLLASNMFVSVKLLLLMLQLIIFFVSLVLLLELLLVLLLLLVLAMYVFALFYLTNTMRYRKTYIFCYNTPWINDFT